jgi:hypothetical protein
MCAHCGLSPGGFCNADAGSSEAATPPATLAIGYTAVRSGLSASRPRARPSHRSAPATQQGYPRRPTTAHLEARLALKRPALRVDEAVIVEYIDELQAVALARGKIVGVVRGRDLAARGTKGVLWLEAPSCSPWKEKIVVPDTAGQAEQPLLSGYACFAPQFLDHQKAQPPRLPRQKQSPKLCKNIQNEELTRTPTLLIKVLNGRRVSLVPSHCTTLLQRVLQLPPRAAPP